MRKKTTKILVMLGIIASLGIFEKQVNVDSTDYSLKKMNTLFADEANFQLYGQIKNISLENGTYDVQIHAQHNSGIKEVKVPIWSKADQSDIKWYQAEKQADGLYIVHMNISNHKYNRGLYTTHVYMYGNDGSVNAISLGQTELPVIPINLTGKIENINSTDGAYDVVISGVNGSGIREIKVPIWSKANQSDIKWYQAEKQTDGTYLVHMNISNHQYNRGLYTTHVYMYGNDGSVNAISLGQTQLPVIPTSLYGEIKEINRDKGSYDVVVKGVNGAGIKDIRVPIWSKTDQSDIKWYQAEKQADGSYVVHMNISNHKYNRGLYTTHVYMYGNDGSVYAISLGQTEINLISSLPIQLSGRVEHLNTENGIYDVIINASQASGIKQILVPIWSKTDQSDIKWYQAEKQSDGSYIVHMNIINHHYNRGNFTTHVYLYANDGSEKSISLGQTYIQEIPTVLNGRITNVNPKDGGYDVEINARQGSGVREVKVPIWSKIDQSDIKWYQAEKQENGTYLVHMNISNHQLHTGIYTTHVYMYANDGSVQAVSLGQTIMDNQLLMSTTGAKIFNVDESQGKYDVIVKVQNPADYDRVTVPTWSASDQSDLVWHEASYIGNGYYLVHISVADHQLLSGNYTSHVYFYKNDKVISSINAGTVSLNEAYKIIDLSEHQKPALINYDELAKHVRGVIVRIQYGSSYEDIYYKRHIQEFQKRGIPVAVYAWVRGTDYADMADEARTFYNRAVQFNPTFWWLDVEEQSMSDMRGGVEVYRSTLKNLGAKKVGVYIANHLYSLFNLDTSKFDGIWIPTYGLNNGLYQGYTPTNTNSYNLHQYTSVGHIAGYSGNLDISRLVNKNFEYFFS